MPFWLESRRQIKPSLSLICNMRGRVLGESVNGSPFLAMLFQRVVHLSAKLELHRFATGPADASESKWAVKAEQRDQVCTAKLTAHELQDFQRIVAADRSPLPSRQ